MRRWSVALALVLACALPLIAAGQAKDAFSPERLKNNPLGVLRPDPAVDQLLTNAGELLGDTTNPGVSREKASDLVRQARELAESLGDVNGQASSWLMTAQLVRPESHSQRLTIERAARIHRESLNRATRTNSKYRRIVDQYKLVWIYRIHKKDLDLAATFGNSLPLENIPPELVHIKALISAHSTLAALKSRDSLGTSGGLTAEAEKVFAEKLASSYPVLIEFNLRSNATEVLESYFTIAGEGMEDETMRAIESYVSLNQSRLSGSRSSSALHVFNIRIKTKSTSLAKRVCEKYALDLLRQGWSGVLYSFARALLAEEHLKPVAGELARQFLATQSQSGTARREKLLISGAILLGAGFEQEARILSEQVKVIDDPWTLAEPFWELLEPTSDESTPNGREEFDRQQRKYEEIAQLSASFGDWLSFSRAKKIKALFSIALHDLESAIEGTNSAHSSVAKLQFEGEWDAQSHPKVECLQYCAMVQLYRPFRDIDMTFWESEEFDSSWVNPYMDNLPHVLISNLYLLKGQKQDAIDTAFEGLSIIGEFGAGVGSWSQKIELSGLLWVLGERDAARVSLQEAEEEERIGQISQDSSDGHSCLDQLYAYLARAAISEDLEAAARLIALAPLTSDYSHEAYYSLSLILEKRGQRELAIVAGKDAVNEIEADIYDEENLIDPKTARRIFSARFGETYQHLARLLIEEGRLQEAEEVLKLLRNEEQMSFVRRSEESPAIDRRVEFVGREAGWWEKWKEIANRQREVLTELQALKQADDRTETIRKRIADLEAEAATIDEAVNAFIARVSEEVKADAGRSEQEAALKLSEAGQIGLIDSRLLDLAAMGSDVVAAYSVALDDSLCTIVVSKEGRQVITTALDRSDLNRMVVEFRTAVSDPTLDPRPSGQRLYEVLVKPVIEASAGRQIIWNLDGPLQYVPLTALWDGKGYLVERMPDIRFSPLAMDVLVLPGRGEQVDAFAATAGTEGYPDLPGAKLEVSALGEQISALVRLDEEFTDQALKDALDLRRRDVLHLATHFRLGKDVYTSSLLLGKRVHASSGSSSRDLTVAEIMDWGRAIFGHLDLLVLSACSTGSGFLDRAQIDGREVGSLATFAMQRGAKSVLVSLWDVSDASTAALMAEFYRNYSKGLPKSEALKSAQLSLLRGARNAQLAAPAPRSESIRRPNTFEIPPYVAARGESAWAHPYYWAPFVLHGNWR